MTLGGDEAGAGRRERRRAAARSWAGGGRAASLRGLEEAAAAAVHRVAEGGRRAAATKDAYAVYKNGKVAEHATLLDTPPAAAVAPPRPPGSGAGQPQAAGGGASSRLRALLGGGRARRAGDGTGRQAAASEGGAKEPLVGGARDAPPTVRPSASLASLRRCETVLALTSVLRPSASSASLEPSRLCSRCSSLLTLASGSRYSLASAGFVPVGATSPPAHCKLCLEDVPQAADVVRIGGCRCVFCHECMKSYVEFQIAGGAYDISCPDAQCPSQGVLTLEEIRKLVGEDMLEKHKKYRLNREVELDKSRTWCPRAGCETVCMVEDGTPPIVTGYIRQKVAPQSVRCPTCSVDFCSSCRLEWHQGVTCEDYGQQLAKEGKIEDVGIPFDTELIKCCPMCNVPIEKDEGCAQMMCKRCKHVFCWYCLASLDDDFLLRHYDKGPCKNKLGHSRASVIWHRAQVIGIFAGFGVLLLVASPLLLLAAPCIVCCKCRVCGGGGSGSGSRLDEETDEPGPAGAP